MPPRESQPPSGPRSRSSTRSRTTQAAVEAAEADFASTLRSALGRAVSVTLAMDGTVHCASAGARLVIGASEATKGFATFEYEGVPVHVSHRGPLEVDPTQLQAHLRRYAGQLGAALARLRAVRPAPLEDAGLLDEATCRRTFRAAVPGSTRAEGELLAPWTRHYAAHYGLPLRLRRSGTDRLVAFPALDLQQSLFLPAPSVFTRWAGGRAYLQDLGYDVDARAEVSIVPTPHTFHRRVQALGLPEPLRPVFAPDPALVIPPARWLAHLRARRLPIHLRAAWKYRWGTPARELMRRVYRPWSVKWHTHFHAFGHDMSLHGLALHRVPADALDALLERAGRARGRSVRRAAGFFEGPLTRRCVELWREVGHPDDFGRAFAAAFPALERGLAERCG